MHRAKHHAALTSVCLLIASHSYAESWRTSGAVYGQFAGISGDAGLGSLRTDVDVSFSDVLDHLDVAGMLVTRVESDAYAMTLHALFIGLEGASSGPGNTFYETKLTQDLIEATWAWRVDERYEVFVGARYQSLGAELDATAANGARVSATQSKRWVDPIVGARAAWPLVNSVMLTAAFDLGGFDVGSKLTWSGLLALDWSFSESVGAVLGYRALGTDYESGSGDRKFVSDTVVAGPLLGIRFNFY